VWLAGKGAGGREAWLERLAGATRVAEVLLLAATALGVQAAAEVALRLDTRVLRLEDTLAEAGVVAGGQVDLWVAVREAGGMLGAMDALQGQILGFVSVLDLVVQQEQATFSVNPLTSKVMLLTAGNTTSLVCASSPLASLTRLRFAAADGRRAARARAGGGCGESAERGGSGAAAGRSAASPN
jgi:hypothetical protein